MGAAPCSALLGVGWGQGLVLLCWEQDGGRALFCTAGGRMGQGVG